jgi:probable rRNA maturation factor
MTHSVNVDVASGRVPLSRSAVAAIAAGVLRAERVRDAMISITFLSRHAMAALNARHLARRGATDVISFAFSGDGNRRESPVLGDIYIAPAVARSNAKRFGIGVREELARLVVHGMLHVLGYEHSEVEDRMTSPMWRRQEKLLAMLYGA